MTKTNKNLFLKALASNYLLFGIITIVGFWLTPYTLRFLTKEEFGLFAIFLDIIVWIKLIEITSGVTQTKLAHYIAEKKFDESERLISTGFIIQLTVGLIVVLFCIFLSFNIELITKDGSSDIRFLKEAFFLIAISSSIDILGQTYSSILNATKRMYIDNIISLVVFLFRVLLIVIFLNYDLYILSLALANLIVSILYIILKIYRVKKLDLEFSIKIKKFCLSTAIYLFDNGKWFTLGGLAGLLILNVDRLVASKTLGLEFVAVYIITYKLYELSEKLITKIVGICRPFISELYAKEEFKKLNHLYVFIDKVYIMSSIIIGLFIFSVSEKFISWWVGDDLFGGKYLSLLMFLNFVFQSMVMSKRAFLASTLYEVRKQNLARLYEGILNLILSLILVSYLGLEGLVLGSIIATILGSNITYNYFVKRLFFDIGNKIEGYLSFWIIILISIAIILTISIYSNEINLYYILAINLFLLIVYVIYISKSLKSNYYYSHLKKTFINKKGNL